MAGLGLAAGIFLTTFGIAQDEAVFRAVLAHPFQHGRGEFRLGVLADEVDGKAGLVLVRAGVVAHLRDLLFCVCERYIALIVKRARHAVEARALVGVGHIGAGNAHREALRARRGEKFLERVGGAALEEVAVFDLDHVGIVGFAQIVLPRKAVHEQIPPVGKTGLLLVAERFLIRKIGIIDPAGGILPVELALRVFRFRNGGRGGLGHGGALLRGERAVGIRTEQHEQHRRERRAADDDAPGAEDLRVFRFDSHIASFLPARNGAFPKEKAREREERG